MLDKWSWKQMSDITNSTYAAKVMEQVDGTFLQ